MNCRDFEAAWNARLDARDSTSSVGGPMETHASACSSCRVLGARFQTLEQASRRLVPPLPPADFAARTLVAAGADSIPLRGWAVWSKRVRLFAAAAALVAAVGVGLWTWTERRDAPVPVLVATVPAPAPEPDDLTAALASATSATLDLAREASAPAARVGRQVLIVAELPSSPSAPALVEGVPEIGISEVWHSVGDRVNDGVRPLSGSARHAFGFLLGTAADDPAPPSPSPAPKRGA